MARHSSRDQIVQTAHDLFYSEGFHAVGLDRILAEVGVTKTTFYNHFESKDDLVAAVLDHHDHWWRGEFVRLVRKHGGDKPREQLLAVFDAIDAMMLSPEYNGCFFINVAVQFPSPHDPANVAARRHKDAMVDIIREIAGYAGADDPEVFARQFCLLMEGAYVTAQIHRGSPTASMARSMATLLVDQHIPRKP